MQLAEASTTVQAIRIPYFPGTPAVQIAKRFEKVRSQVKLRTLTKTRPANQHRRGPDHRLQVKKVSTETRDIPLTK